MMWWSHNDFGWAGWTAMSVSMLFMWAAVGAVIYGLFRLAGGLPPYRADARAILDRRLARGDITPAEYIELMNALGA